ncbi:MAG: Ger(x)C family spore germination C-terminal domain-containing protein [Alicyclobacillus sp.]|nr:Ger(x)C family spore germination C-terminal domain-containing protein [Alicyclobacillus sp.]
MGILALWPISGCADYAEVDDLLVVSGMSIDFDHNSSYVVTCDIVNPEQGTSQESRGTGNRVEDIIVSGQGPTMESAIDQIQRQLPHRLYFAHNVLVVFRDTALRDRFPEMMDYLERNLSMRRSQWWAVTTASATNIWKGSSEAQQAKAVRIREILERSAAHASVFRSDQLEVAKSLAMASETGHVAWIEPSFAAACVVKGIAGVSLGGRVARFNTEEDPSMLWWARSTHDILQDLRIDDAHTTTSSASPTARRGVGSATSEVRRTAAIRWSQTECLIKWAGTADHPVFRVDWYGVGTIERWVPGTPLNAQALRLVETSAQRELPRQMLRGWRESVRKDMDVLGLENVAYQSNPRAYRVLHRQPDWWHRAEIQIHVHPRILRTGLSATSPTDVYSAPQGQAEPQGGHAS